MAASDADQSAARSASREMGSSCVSFAGPRLVCSGLRGNQHQKRLREKAPPATFADESYSSPNYTSD